MKGSPGFVIACAPACALGFAFAAVSTSDFVAHLDRQVHGVHCSFLPGLAAADYSGNSGCHATLMSPYSSVLREELWGGVPIALPGMAVFAFLFAWCVWLLLYGRAGQSRATGFLFLGSLVPLLSSMAMGYLSLVELDAACKSCIGIYIASALTSACAFGAWLRARSAARQQQWSNELGAAPRPPLSYAALAGAFVLGALSVAFSVGAYAASVPDFSSYVGACGELQATGSGVTVGYGPQRGRPTLLEVMDPLCPSCRSFEARFESSKAADRVDRQLLLFPLDQACNWMIDHSIHPGACSISEAVLCADDPAPVLAWAFEKQREIMAAAEKHPAAAEAMAKARFPTLAACIGSAQAEARLNQSLRFAVKNQLQVLTPQVFVEGVRLCGEDTDLGLDFALARLIERVQSQPSVRDDLAPRRRESARREEGLALRTPPGASSGSRGAESKPEGSGRAARSAALAAQIRREAVLQASRGNRAASNAPSPEPPAPARRAAPEPAEGAPEPAGSAAPKPSAERSPSRPPKSQAPEAETPEAETPEAPPEPPAGGAHQPAGEP